MRPLIIISFDGLDSNDIAYLKDKPAFKRYLEQASGSQHVTTIYPSVTYAAHASIVTGCYPIKHAIVDNTKVQPERYQNPDWYWYRQDIAVETLYDLAKKNNYSTAALLWPTTGRANIDYNMPEIFSNRKWTSQLMVSLYAGSPLYQSHMVMKYGQLRQGKKQPELDHFTFACTLETLKTQQPDLLMVHLTDLDSMRHLYGHDSSQAYQALDRHANKLDQLLETLDSIAKYRDSYLVVLGDHSSIDVTKGISINSALRQWGFLDGDHLTICRQQAFAKSCDGSCYIYLSDGAIEQALRDKLEQLHSRYSHAFRILDRTEIVAKGADQSAFVMLEAEPPYHFVEDFCDAIVNDLSDIPYYRGKSLTAVHGFDPTRTNYQTVFYLRGSNVKQAVALPKMHIVDIAPTLADFLGFDLKDCDGHSHYKQLVSEVTS